MSNSGQGQQAPGRDSFVTLEELESIKNAKGDQKHNMILYLRNLNEKIQNTSEGSAEHQDLLQRLRDFTTKLRSQVYKQQQAEHAQQAQNRIVQQGQAKPQPPAQGQQGQQGQQSQQSQQQGNRTTSQQQGQPNQFSAEVVQRARNLQVPNPPDMSPADAQKYVQEQKKQYAQFLSQHENAEKLRQQTMQLMEQKRNQGQDVSQETAKVAKAEEFLRKTKANIEAFERKQMENRARQQAAQQSSTTSGGGAGSAASQGQQNQQVRPNQPGQAMAESAMNPASPAQQQQASQHHQQQSSQHANNHAPQGQQPTPQQNISQQNANPNAARPVLNVQQANQAKPISQASPHTQASHNAAGTGVQALTHEAAMSAAARSYSAQQQQAVQQAESAIINSSGSSSQGASSQPQSQSQPQGRQTQTPQSSLGSAPPLPLQSGSNLGTGTATTSSSSSNNNVRFPIPKTLNTTAPVPVQMAPARPTLGGPVSGAPGVLGQPAMQKHPGYILEGEGDRVLSKKKLDELVRQVTGGGEGPGESLTPEVEEAVLQMADDFVDNVVTAACRVAKLRSSATLDIKDLQLIVERNYNIRVPGYASDEVRTVRKFQPAPGWTQKMNAVQAAKVMGGKTDI